ncbi:hypothetical protein [Nocardioides szechwanensis]
MANRDNGDGRGFYMTVRSLAEMAGSTESVAERAIGELRKAGWITQTRQGRGGVASRYALTYPPRAEPVAQHPAPEVLESSEPERQHPAPEVLESSQHPASGGQVDQLLPYRPEEPLPLPPPPPLSTRSHGGSGEGRRSFGRRAIPVDEPATRFIPKRVGP